MKIKEYTEMVNNKYYAGRFSDKVMIITGAATGIGRATAIRAAKEQATLVLVDLKKQEGEQLLKEVLEIGAKAIFLALNLSKEEDAQQMLQQTVEHFGRLDIAINNAGVMGEPAPIHELTTEKMDFTMQNNLYSVFYCAKAEIQQFLKQGDGGVIVNNASIAGLTGLPGNPAYVASKHAVNGLTRNMALDYAKYGIRVNSVNPAGTDTPMVEQAMEFVKSKMAQAIANDIPKEKAMSMAGDKMQNIQHRNASPEEQAASILFLASDDATHLTGTLLATDGGWTAF